MAKKATQQTTIEALLDSSGRDNLPLAHLFVQHRDPKDRGRPGPLSWFVEAHHERGLQQYLLAHAVASGGDWGVVYDSRIWARALGLSEQHASSRNAVSRTWRWLERHSLITRSRKGRLSKITLLYDDGSGRGYVHPNDRGDRYLKLPYAYWRDEWYRKLDLSALAVLLIALSLPKSFPLPMERVPEWYGMSTTTFQKGARALRRHGLLKHWYMQEARPLAPEGFTRVNYYELEAPFAKPGRKKKS
jgi:hypothetical protein